MGIYLSHRSAARFLMCRGASALADPSRSRMLKTSRTELRARGAAVKGMLEFDGVLDVLVPGQDARVRSSCVESHVWSGELLPGSFIPLGNDVFCSSPEFVVVQLAPRLPVVRLAQFITDLCGIYAYDAPWRQQILLCPPITNLKRIEAFAHKLSGGYGSARVIRALAYALERSASPWETKLALINTLKPALGGYGFPKPLLNHPVELGKLSRRMTHRRRYVCDEYWPAFNLDLEFNGARYHDNDQQAREDERRRKVLEYGGIKVVDVRAYELANVGLYDDIARQLARRMGKQLRVFDARHRRARLELRALLFGEEGHGAW